MSRWWQGRLGDLQNMITLSSDIDISSWSWESDDLITSARTPPVSRHNIGSKVKQFAGALYMYIQDWAQPETRQRSSRTLCVSNSQIFNCNWWLCWVEMVHPMNTFKYTRELPSLCSSDQSYPGIIYSWFCCTSSAFRDWWYKVEARTVCEWKTKTLPASCSVCSCLERLWSKHYL